MKREFFVGYLDTPAGLVRFYRVLIPVLLVLAIAVGLWIASSQKSVGEGVWDLSGETQLSGYLTVDPYPVLHLSGSEPRSVILVQRGKRSANELASPFADQWVSVSGFAISRGAWSMLELRPGAEFTVQTNSGQSELAMESLGEISLQGEILDSKCFLGVMKPGSGKVHRACAAMCLLGGLPPMFVVSNPAGEQFGYMLTNAAGDSAAIELAELAAVPVRLTGQLERRGDMLYIRYNESNLTGLSAIELSDYGQTLSAN